MTRIGNPHIRAGIVWGAMLGIWLVLGLARAGLHGEGYTLAGHIQSAVLATLLAVPMVIAVRRWLDGGTLAGLGLEVSPAAIKPFAVGALAFLAPSALGFALVLGLGWARITPLAPWGEILAFVPLLVLLVVFYEALPEELAFRGYIYRVLAERHARITAVVAQALLFGLWGALLWTVFSGTPALDRLVMFCAIGFVLGLVRAMTGSVWATIGLHTGFQTVAQLLLNTERGHFAVENADILQLVAIGIVPFSLATMLVQRIHRRKVEWTAPEGRTIS